MIVLLQDDIIWEFDFINIEILSNKYEISTFRANEQPPFANIIIFNYKFKNSMEYVKKNKPHVVLFMSDERGGYASVTEYARHTHLFIYCYNHDYTYLDNSVQMPLGYVAGFLKGKSIFDIEQKPISEREIIIAFIGDSSKNDRPLMIKKMKELTSERGLNSEIIETVNSWKLDKQKITPEDIFTTYSNSIFVPIGRGYYSLDCFRIYEAIAAGAIPIIVGPKSEIDISFEFNGHSLPALYFDSWDAAKTECGQLLDEPAKLQKIQDELILWFKSRITEIRTLVTRAIDETPMKVSVKRGKKLGGAEYNIAIFDVMLIIILLLYYVCYRLWDSTCHDFIDRVSCRYYRHAEQIWR